jgi:hypothetical protein
LPQYQQRVSASDEPIFSVCTLVTDPDQYAQMKASFIEHGFTAAQAEFLEIDNSRGNQFDAYRGLGKLLDEARGRYVVLCHQDLLLLDDGAEQLRKQLELLDEGDPKWAIAGNSGITPDNRHVLHISDPHGDDQRQGPLPARAQSLDENFLIVRRASRIRPSAELSGFHLYATDLCLQAARAGLSAWVIDFHLCHLSGGNMSTGFFREEEKFEQHWSEVLPRALVVRTTCTELILGTDLKARWLRRLRAVRRHPLVYRLTRPIRGY